MQLAILLASEKGLCSMQLAIRLVIAYTNTLTVGQKAIMHFPTSNSATVSM